MATTTPATTSPRTTLEQQRAADAWVCAQGRSSKYVNLAKALPALIMNSGLLQVLAFLHEKSAKPAERHCGDLGDQLRRWLHKRFPDNLDGAGFPPFMQSLMAAEPQTFQAVTTEALAWLRWLRQIAPAVPGGTN